MDNVGKAVPSAGWALRSETVTDRVQNLNMCEILDTSEPQMKAAPGGCSIAEQVSS